MIESGLDFARRRYAPGTVARVTGGYLIVRSLGPRGGTFIERYSTRDGTRLGRGQQAQLVHPTDGFGVPAPSGRTTRQIDVLYRAWSRRRDDVDALRALQNAIAVYLDDATVS